MAPGIFSWKNTLNKISESTNKTHSGKKPPEATWGQDRIFTWSHECQ